MPIPETNKIIYENNPLTRVICQVRFPTIFKIDTEAPSLFQEKIKSQYINVREGKEVTLDIKIGNPQVVSDENSKPFIQTTNKRIEFFSEDEKWRVTISRNSLSFLTTNYVRWSEFKPKFIFVLENFIEAYSPSVFTRIGLRYVDIITRSKLGIDNMGWNQLINPDILGILNSKVIGENIDDFQTIFLLKLDGDNLVQVRSGIVKSTLNPEEICFMIDSDFFKLKNLQYDELVSTIDYFNTKAFGLFKLCITEKLHNAMKPKTVE